MNIEIQKFFEKYDAKRTSKGLIVRGIAKTELKPLFENRKVLNMKYANHNIPSNISICDNKMALISWGEKPTGILIKSEQLCKNQIEFFESLWKTTTHKNS